MTMQQTFPIFEQPPTRLAEYEIGEGVELRGLPISRGDYHWISGYFVVVQKWENGQWWYAVTRPLISANLGANTQTSDPIYYPESAIRKAQIIERHPQILSHYHGKNYWVQIGNYYRQIDLPCVEV